jgi:peroxiredoxin Q/BCP
VTTGDQVADFELPDASGTPRRLAEFLGQGPVVLFFYPAALSKGCTAEACRFRDLAAEFAALGAEAIGISPDPVDRQREFATRETLGMPLLSDVDGVVARQFEVKRRLGLIPVKRHTFISDRNGQLLEIVKSEVRMAVHGDRALEALRKLR